ncbi:MAG: glycosyltransferase family 2 protein [Candidatus Doudnabacteria bacterium]|nr:glycosyltransferase family 2 protein [Candidatus Doudnabacteria bacterium]
MEQPILRSIQSDNELVSIIVPIYNSARYLEKCLNSIISQTYINTEIILIDDGSTDGSAAICKKYARRDNRISVVYTENNGVSSARNTGISKAKGKYINFLDADDWIEKDALTKMVSMMKNNSADCIRVHYFVDSIKQSLIARQGLSTGMYSKNKIPSLINDLLLAKDNCYCFLLMVRADLIRNNNILFPTEVSMMEDVLFYIDVLSAADQIFISSLPLYHYVQNANSASRSISKLLDNASSTLSASNLIAAKISGSSLNTLVDIGKVRAIHLSLIASRPLNVALLSQSSLKLKDIKVYMQSVMQLEGIHMLVKEADLSSLQPYLRYSVTCLINDSPIGLLFWLKLRMFVVRLRKVKDYKFAA